MKLKMFGKKEEVEMGDISLTFKMPLINFLNYFKSNNSWEVTFNDGELDKLEEAVKRARKGKSQELLFEDDFKIKNKNERRYN